MKLVFAYVQLLSPFIFPSQAADLRVELTSTLKTKDFSAKAVNIPFGTIFTDHMLTVEWDVAEGWQAPHIKPFGNLSIHPACSSLHYAIQVELLILRPKGREQNRARKKIEAIVEGKMFSSAIA